MPHSNFILRHGRQEPGRIASQANLWNEAKQWEEVLRLVYEISLSYCILMSSRLRIIILFLLRWVSCDSIRRERKCWDQDPEAEGTERHVLVGKGAIKKRRSRRGRRLKGRHIACDDCPEENELPMSSNDGLQPTPLHSLSQASTPTLSIGSGSPLNTPLEDISTV